MLLDPLVHTSDISEEEHRSVMIGLLTQGHPKLALKYCNVRKPPQRKPVDIQLNISILLTNGNVSSQTFFTKFFKSMKIRTFHMLFINLHVCIDEKGVPNECGSKIITPSDFTSKVELTKI